MYRGKGKGATKDSSILTYLYCPATGIIALCGNHGIIRKKIVKSILHNATMGRNKEKSGEIIWKLWPISRKSRNLVHSIVL